MFLLSFFIFFNSFIQLLEGEKIVECWKTLETELHHEIQHGEISYKHSCGKGTLILLSRLKTDNTYTEHQILISLNSVSLGSGSQVLDQYFIRALIISLFGLGLS